ncbi:MAG: VanZ family protein [Micromonosporaceae bacterium]
MAEQLWQNWLAYRGGVLVGVVALAFGYAWWRWYRPHRHGAAEAAMVCGTVPWLYLAMLPHGDGPGGVSLVPLRDLALFLPDPVDFVTQVVGNLLVFAALGFFAPVRFAALASVPRMFAVGAAGSLAIELAQLLARTGRVFSVDDILLNAAGAALAAALSRGWWAQEPVHQVNGRSASA